MVFIPTLPLRALRSVVVTIELNREFRPNGIRTFMGRIAMSHAGEAGRVFAASAIVLAAFAAVAQAQQTQYPKPTELPNPYRLVEGWPTLPKNMNGGKWGEVIRVNVAHDGNIWV